MPFLPCGGDDGGSTLPPLFIPQQRIAAKPPFTRKERLAWVQPTSREWDSTPSPPNDPRSPTSSSRPNNTSSRTGPPGLKCPKRPTSPRSTKMVLSPRSPHFAPKVTPLSLASECDGCPTSPHISGAAVVPCPKSPVTPGRPTLPKSPHTNHNNRVKTSQRRHRRSSGHTQKPVDTLDLGPELLPVPNALVDLHIIEVNLAHHHSVSMHN